MPGVSPMEKRPSALREIAKQRLPLAIVKRAYTRSEPPLWAIADTGNSYRRV
jgi:hypothetical protein